MADTEIKKKRTFRKFTFRGVDLDQLLDMSYEQLMQLYCARQRRRLNRGLRRKQQSLLKRLRKAKKEAPPMEKPEVVKTHLRDMVILPEMVGSMVGVYNGKTFNQVEIKVRCNWLGGSETVHFETLSCMGHHVFHIHILISSFFEDACHL
ncbi:putative 40S ribosomal protein S15-like isoform 4 [Scophthalmus maximus]|uniref:40S ribosomal protein S15 n=1 Tax=Scophthalmus maximus TaxID=52904 RepID=A0A2U9BL94_SCOMX|nr:putative 40S ribosomal protein S15-like isoform 4 [Scophthalmus maximus]